MLDCGKVLGIIPARGGSKGVPRKNIKPLLGKPLIAWTIEAAKQSMYIDSLVLSSEDPEIIQVAKDWGCEAPFIRPEELARDETSGMEPVFHALKQLPGYEYVVLLQPTSPLRQAEDIDACLIECLDPDTPACVSVVETVKSPYWMYSLNDKGRLDPLLKNNPGYERRQDTPKTFALNGAVYTAKTAFFLEKMAFVTEFTKAYVMPDERSLDMDSELDFVYAELLLKRSAFSSR